MILRFNYIYTLYMYIKKLEIIKLDRFQFIRQLLKMLIPVSISAFLVEEIRLYTNTRQSNIFLYKVYVYHFIN